MHNYVWLCTIARAKTKKKHFIKFLSLLSLKKIFSLSFFFSLSNFFFSLHLLSVLPIYSGSSSSLPICSRFVFITNLHLHCLRRRPILPSPPSHRSPNANKPSPPPHRRSKLHCRPKLHRWSNSTGIAFIELKSAHGFRGWISWLWSDFMGFSRFRDSGLAGFHSGWVSWVSGGVAVLVVICVVVFG